MVKVQSKAKSKIQIDFRNTNFDDVDSWSVLYPPDKDGIFKKIVAGPWCCREELIGDVMSSMTYGKNKAEACEALMGYKGRSYLMITMSAYLEDLEDYPTHNYYCNDSLKRRREEEKRFEAKVEKVALRCHKQTGKKIKDAVRLLNYFEDTAGWRRSKLIIGPHLITSNWYDWGECAAWVLEINNKWLISSYTLSMVTLILRSGIYRPTQTIKRYANGYPWKRFVDKNELCDAIGQPSDLQERIDETARLWIPLLKNFDKIFPGYKKEPLKFWQGVTPESGISSLFAVWDNGWWDNDEDEDDLMDSPVQRARKLKPLFKRSKK